ncbi:uncharacterized protein SPSK_10092 [Sporothrix schenckii 1099-18]|uniref:Uncharacterized protein n=1 Tax=Sporothrix schenckii 1099-18 TaxID=1397361 RepID=A0A0F2M8I8_SPOSC|nr:uncharacterized protein SPSK_10092 [Sporothrix schenckii 1099-18]KJR84476.1 hypothetical protein SPSK_10092 [Sporothrix schenckii 1099-18]
MYQYLATEQRDDQCYHEAAIACRAAIKLYFGSKSTKPDASRSPASDVNVHRPTASVQRIDLAQILEFKHISPAVTIGIHRGAQYVWILNRGLATGEDSHQRVWKNST